MFTKTRVAVLRGGPSSEYETSLRTGATVLAHLPDAYHGLDVFVDKKGNWHLHGKREDPHKVLGKVDVVLNALHGEYGEDGNLQNLLDAHGVPFTGPKQFSAALAMNKRLAKDILAKEGIRTPYAVLLRKERVSNPTETASELYRTFPMPAVIKPVARGSSLGVSIARTAEEIAYALSLALELSDSVLIEEYIEGPEIVCGIIEGYRGEDLYTLLPVQVVLPPGSTFFDYHTKYSAGATYSIPSVSPDTRTELQSMAADIHRLLGLRHYSSMDFIVHPRRGTYFLEADALPPLCDGSPFHAAVKGVGGTLPHFLEHLISLALKRSNK